MKSTNIKIICCIIAILVSIAIPMKSFAMAGLGEMVKSAEEFISQGEKEETIKEEDLIAFVNPVGQILTTLATVILVIVAVVMGIKYMVSGPDEQGKLKKQLVGLVVSALVVFAGHTIWTIMYDLLKDFNKRKGGRKWVHTIFQEI